MKQLYIIMMSVVMALNVSHAADDPAIISNKAPELINSWISANNHRSIETIQTLLDPNASIKITDPVTGTLTQYNREEFLQVFPDMWKESLEYTLSVLDYSILGNVLVLRVNETSTQAVGTISHNATETFELYEKDGQLKISSIDISPDKERNRPQQTGPGYPPQGVGSPDP